jgi:hypothetical protein
MNCSEEDIQELIQIDPRLVHLRAADDLPPILTVFDEEFTEVE